MNRISCFLILLFSVLLTGCDSMEDNYVQYLEDTKIYSPKVTGLDAVVGLREATLLWKNPTGNIAVKNIILLNDSTIYPADTLVTTYKLTDLEIKGYTISVYTVDGAGNYSIPATINIFPNGEN
ncbi:MAG: DUF4998 domain-containing protein [Paludibacter sp.]|nr:DUF4998 domain-containing protein [Paludibacter sp.]